MKRRQIWAAVILSRRIGLIDCPDLVLRAAARGAREGEGQRHDDHHGRPHRTADPHVSTGTTPGIGVLKVLQGGRSARFESIARITNVVGGVERADVHASTVRVKN
jgi:hypothetical protein